MLNVSNATKEAFMTDGSHKVIKVTFPNLKDSSGNPVIFTNSHINAESLTVKESLQNSNSLDYIGCIASNAEIEIIDAPYEFKDQVITISVTADNTDEIPLFYGKVDKVTKESAYAMVKKIEAIDFMNDYEDKDASEWYHSLTYPITYKQFRDSFWKKFGKVENADNNQETISLINDDMVIAKKQLSDDSKMTAASIIKAICQVNACFGQFNRIGQFRYVYLEEIQEALYPSDDLFPDNALFPSDENKSASVFSSSGIFSIKYEDHNTKPVVGVVIYDDTAETTTTEGETTEEKSAIGKAGQTGEDDNKFEIENNFLVYGFGGTPATTMCERILSKIKPVIYRETDITVKSLPYVLTGDIMVAQGAKDIIRTYVLTRTIKGTSLIEDEISAKGEDVNSGIISIDELITAEIFRRKIGNEHMYSLVEQTKDSLELSIKNVDQNLKTSIQLTDGKIVAEVERAQNSESAITTRVTLTENAIQINSQNINTLSQNLNVVTQNLNLKANQASLDASNLTISSHTIAINANTIAISGANANIEALQAETASIRTLAASKITADQVTSELVGARLAALTYVTVKSLTCSSYTITYNGRGVVATPTVITSGSKRYVVPAVEYTGW